jgi:hypothetical protein
MKKFELKRKVKLFEESLGSNISWYGKIFLVGYTISVLLHFNL